MKVEVIWFDTFVSGHSLGLLHVLHTNYVFWSQTKVWDWSQQKIKWPVVCGAGAVQVCWMSMLFVGVTSAESSLWCNAVVLRVVIISVQLCVSRPDVTSANSTHVASSQHSLSSCSQLLECHIFSRFNSQLSRTSEVAAAAAFRFSLVNWHFFLAYFRLGWAPIRKPSRFPECVITFLVITNTIIALNTEKWLWPTKPPILQALYRSTCISWHLQLRTGGFCWCRVLLPTCPCWQQPAHFRLWRRCWSSHQRCCLNCLYSARTLAVE